MPNAWPLSCGRARSYHALNKQKPHASLKPAAVSFSGLLGSALQTLDIDAN
jgi:hypothetical protein